jgi:membrane fusion protein, multidrug efflux system
MRPGINLPRLKVLLLLAAVSALAGCNKTDPVQAAAKTSRPAPPVIAATVEQRDIPIQILAIGNVEAYQTVQIRSQVNGQIQKILFHEGDEVRAGQMLVQLDKRQFQADLDKATAQLGRDQAQSDNSRVQATRYSELEKQGVISREQADQMRTLAKADAAAVEGDKAAIEYARVQLQYTDISSPMDARAGAVLIDVGNLVKANDTPYMVQLNQLTPIYVTFSVPESRLADVRRYFSTGRLKVLAYPKGEAPKGCVGRLSFIDNGVDTTTGAFKLKATFDNKDRRLWPGEYVDVALELSIEKNAVTVPTKAVLTGQQGEYVYVLRDDSTAEPRLVKARGAYQNLTVIADGLKAGERVIVDGQLRVVPNTKVAVQNAPPGGGADTSGKEMGGAQ